MRWIRRLTAGCGLALLGLAPLRAEPASELAQPNPAAAIGRLPNGLRYAVMTRPTADHVAMALYVGAGSMGEAGAQAGVADLAARIAFARANTLGPFNGGAKTDSVAATYGLELPSATVAQVRRGLAWLRGIADGVDFTPAAVEAARKAWADNQAQGDKTGAALEAAASRLFTPQLRPQAPPTASAQALQAFYRRWYRPDNAILVIVGPLPKAALQAEAAKAFGSWAKPSAGLVPPRIDPPDPARPLQTSAYSAAGLFAAVQACRTSPAAKHEAESVSAWRRRLADAAWAFAIESRLRRMGAADQPNLAEAKAGLDTNPPLPWSQACVRVAGLDQNWQGEATLLEHEVRRMALYGVTDEELERFQAAQRAVLDASVADSPGASVADLADIILINMVTGDTYDTAEEDRRIHTLALMKLDKADVDAAFRSDWSQAGQPLIFVTAADPVAADRVRAVWLKAQADPLSPPPAHTPEPPSAPSRKPGPATMAQAAGPRFG